MQLNKNDIALLEQNLHKDKIEKHLRTYYRALNSGNPELYVCAKEQIENDLRRLRNGTFK